MAWGTFTESDFLTLDGNYEFFIASSDAIVLALNPGESVTFRFHVDDVGTTDDVTVQVLQGHRISNGNGLDGATSASDVELDTAADGFSSDDDMNGTYIIMTSGDERGEGRLITDSVAADDGVNLSHALSGTPSASETYALYAFFETIAFDIDVTSGAPSDSVPHNAGVAVSAFNGQYVAVRAKSGSTDAHRIRLSYQVDGVSL